MGGDHEADLRSSWRQGNGWAIIEGSPHPTFRVGAHLIGGTCKRLRDHLQIQEAVVTTWGDYPKTSRQNIDERSGVAVKAIET